MKRSVLFVLWLLAGTSALLWTFYNLLIGVAFSEALWTFYFHLLDQEDMGLASDLEILTVLLVGFILSYWIGSRYLHADMESRRRFEHRFWMIVGTIGFIYWWKNASTAIPFSEMVEDIYYRMVDEPTDHMLVANLEFLTVVVMGVCLSWLVDRLVRMVNAHIASRKS
ncbi:hypothetical protein [Noviherbaspirillum sp.]|uniref:hypothetical protein n=1 Tax=Noviherbaspirillum sp. TaxID=1926288 RepID=UPI002FE1B0C4